jgi:hypothetical protein
MIFLLLILCLQEAPVHRSAWSEPPDPGHTNQAYVASPTEIATEPAPPIQIATRSLDRHPPRADDHTNLEFSSAMFAATSSLAQGGSFREPQRPPHHQQNHRQRPHSAVPNGKPSSHHTPRKRSAWGDEPTDQQHSPQGKKHSSRIDVEPGDDELDIAQKAAMAPGQSPQPLISSIREEIQRLASKATH